MANNSDEFTYYDNNGNISINCPHLDLHTPEGYCSPFHDQLSCWPATPANTTAELLCPVNAPIPTAYAFRYCPSDSSWEDGRTDYSACMNNTPESTTHDPYDALLAITLRDIYFILSTVSLVLLLITLFIFQYFRSLHCSRISIHKHLVVSFIFRFIVIIIVTEPFISERKTSYRDVEWLCKLLAALVQYTTLANVFWMFVEGFFLHHSLVLGVFSTQAPFKLFYFIGWGLPALFVIAWCIVLHFSLQSHCWTNYSQLSSHWIIIAPFVLALVVNLVFLVNIIRVLVSKLRANNRIESANIRKAIKATVVLMPLLGITNLLFIISPDNRGLKMAYHVTNAVLHSSQGIFVAILYCFLNGEVRRVIKQKWYRFRMRHGRHTSGRRRSSRTSSFFLPSGTEFSGKDDELSETVHAQSKNAEHLRLLQANLALQNDTDATKQSTEVEEKQVVTNGSTDINNKTKRNNNNGEVRFAIECNLERETVI